MNWFFLRFVHTRTSISTCRLFCTADKEIWRTCVIQEYLNCPDYEVSNFGQVRNIVRAKILKQSQNMERRRIQLTDFEGIRKFMLLSRLVCFTHHGPPGKDEIEVDHINGDSTDNRAENLQWITKSKHSKKTHAARKDRRSRGIPIMKVSVDDEKIIHQYKSYVETSKIEGITGNYIFFNQICDNSQNAVKWILLGNKNS